MIYKSYLVEQNINNIKNNIVLFYGENQGLKNDFKNKLKEKNKKNLNISITQDEILSDTEKFFRDVLNKSLFEEEKIFFIYQANDKILTIVEEITEKNKNQKIYLFCETLEKKSKLRNYFEKSNKFGVIACYPDNEITLKRIIQDKLKNYQGLSPQNMNLIIDNSNLDRVRLNNELDKIITFFPDKKIQNEALENLLNLRTNSNFNNLKNEALSGNKIKTNKLISDTILEEDKIILYLNLIKQRLHKLLEANQKAITTNLEEAISELKPPIFWKDLPIFKVQAKKWNKEKINKILNIALNLELKIKSKTSIQSKPLIKKFLVDICVLANS